jgi:signal transduction histidine kinase
MPHRLLDTLRAWFALDSAFERVPSDAAVARRQDVWLGLALAALSVGSAEISRSVGVFDDTDAPAWLILTLTGVAALPLMVRRRYPLTVLVIVYAHFLVVGLTVPMVTQTLVIQGVYFVALYSAVAWGRDRQAMLVVVAACLLAVFTWLLWQLAVDAGMREAAERAGILDDPPGFIDPVVAMTLNVWMINVAFFFGAVVTGQYSWNAARRRQQLAEQAATIERQAAALQERAVVTERLRIARELHDVVAHHVSVIGIHAAAARRQLAKDPAAAAAPLATIETASRDAVEQMRGLVGTLRAGDDDAPRAGSSRAPEPGLGDIAALVEADDGLTVTCTTVSEPAGAESQVPAPVGLSLYRTVQEALANVRKHSTARTAGVTVRVDRRGVVDDPRFAHGFAEVEVLDDGRARPGSAGTGLGLMGLRERVAVHHGAAEIGPRVTGGYRVRVRLPLPKESS